MAAAFGKSLLRFQSSHSAFLLRRCRLRHPSQQSYRFTRRLFPSRLRIVFPHPQNLLHQELAALLVTFSISSASFSKPASQIVSLWSARTQSSFSPVLVRREETVHFKPSHASLANPRRRSFSWPSQVFSGSFFISDLFGFSFRNAHGILYHCHSAISSYCAEIAEEKAALAVTHGTQPKVPRQRCRLFSFELYLPSLFLTSRTLHQTLFERLHHFAIQLVSKQVLLARKSKIAGANKHHAHGALHDFPLVSYLSFPKTCSLYSVILHLSLHNIFSYGHPLSFQFDFLNVLKHSAIKPLTSEALRTTNSPFYFQQSFILRLHLHP